MIEDQPLADRLLSLIKATAITAASKDAEEREAYLAANKAEYCAYALEAQGVTDEQADDWARQMDEWVRAMLEIVLLGDIDPDATP